MIKNKIIYTFLLFILLGDFTYSFLQYYSTPLDGDMASTILPTQDIQEIFDDPFGIGVIIKNKPHLNPNRYFAHLFFSTYFKNIPSIFQNIVNPIKSIYISAAAIKLLIQVLITYLLSALISKTKSIANIKLLIVALLLTLLFQTYGYNRYMGIIDISITYTFFYALPLLLLFFFFFRFYTIIYNNVQPRLTITSKILLSLMVIILPFSGALIPPILLIVSVLLFVYYFRKPYKTDNNYPLFKKVISTFNILPNVILIFFIPICVLSIYSLFLGSYNTLYQSDIIPIAERYLKLPIGIYYQLTQKLGFPLLFIIVTVNILIIKKYYYTEDGKKIITSLKWIGIFSLIYILLLPLGGYRPYRANILRYDTFMPITLCLIYIYGISSYFLLKNIKKRKSIYLSVLISFLLIFTNADISELNKNNCEKQALKTIVNSNKSIVPLEKDCKILSWNVITDYKQSELNAELLMLWKITKTKKLYYNRQPTHRKNK